MIRIDVGDCRELLSRMPEKSVNTCVTSPPYFGLRDYDREGQIGLEQTPDEYVAAMVSVFREVYRVLRDDGTLWLNLGDSYAGSGKGAWNIADDEKKRRGVKETYRPMTAARSIGNTARDAALMRGAGDDRLYGLKAKDLIGIPWRVALALQADGWYLRQDIIWHKPNPMPESVTDRCTKAHEYIFLLSKSPRYYFDSEAIKEIAVCARIRGPALHADVKSTNGNAGLARRPASETRNRRSVWSVTTKPFKGAHFATFPPDLIEPCVLAGAPIGGLVLDPFGGAGTTALVAERNGRDSVLLDLNEDYAYMARRRNGLPDIKGQIRAFGRAVEAMTNAR